MKTTNAKRILCVLLAVAALTACIPFTAFAASYSVVRIPEGDYYICASSNDGYAISVEGSSTAQGTYFHLWEKIDGNPDQIFTIEHVSGDWYRIRVKQTGLCLNVPGGNSANGQKLWTWSSLDYTDSSLFRFAYVGNGTYIIQNKMGRAIDLDNNLIFNGSRIHLWDVHGGPSEGWKLVSAGSVSSAAGTSTLPSGIVIKQAAPTSCTLAASVMMLRARAHLDGRGYSHITESGVRRTAWVNGAGLKHSFSYDGYSVRQRCLSGYSTSAKKQAILEELKKHPEGIVIWDNQKPHAVHLTHYKDGVFYVNDPSDGSRSVSLANCRTICGSGLDGKIAHMYRIWYIAN